MKKDLLSEIATFVKEAKDSPWLLQRGIGLLEDATLAIVSLRASHTRLHRRAQEAEAALPEWREICRATEHQATGRFFPALIRLGLTQLEEENGELVAKLRRRGAAIVSLRHALIKACWPVCGDCGVMNCGTEVRHRAGCQVELLTSDTPANRELTDGSFRVPVRAGPRRFVQREIDSVIGPIPGTANMGPGLEERQDD